MGNAFDVLFRGRDRGTGEVGAARIVRIDRTGAMSVGPRTREVVGGRPFLVGPPLRIIDDRAVHRVDQNLRIAPETTLAGWAFDGGQAGDAVWIIGHVPDGTGAGRWWPLTGPPVGIGPGCSLLTLLDPGSLTPIRSVPVGSSQLDVTTDTHGVIWIRADGVHRLDPATGPTTALDVAALLDTARTTEN
ncbi:hypothetical protein [Rhodococcus jostii]|uniref:hypothetical protein n=1 Tax=Rhodococcus jostii TaxID=132919 RepID=UPI00364204BD